ncbi:MAG: hypothetical protein ACI97K_002033 [Glaciecola sp.]|jgi:hypothetical protein
MLNFIGCLVRLLFEDSVSLSFFTLRKKAASGNRKIITGSSISLRIIKKHPQIARLNSCEKKVPIHLRKTI